MNSVIENMNSEVPKIEHIPSESPINEIHEPLEEKDLSLMEVDRVNHYFIKNKHSEGVTEWFTLPTEIDALSYSFDLVSSYGMFELSFATQEYGFAATNLSDEGQAKVEESLEKLVQSVLLKYPLTELYVKPAPEPAVVTDIEECIEEILLERDYLTREQLLQKYKEEGWSQLFADYRYIVGKVFQKSSTSNDRTVARSRLFKMGLKRLFPDWEISEVANKWVLRQKDL